MEPVPEATPVSLLERLRDPAEKDAWPRFVQLYTPLLFYRARGAGLQTSDAADLVRDVFVTLVQKMPTPASPPPWTGPPSEPLRGGGFRVPCDPLL
jgi:hypothetical protein